MSFILALRKSIEYNKPFIFELRAKEFYVEIKKNDCFLNFKTKIDILYKITIQGLYDKEIIFCVLSNLENLEYNFGRLIENTELSLILK